VLVLDEDLAVSEKQPTVVLGDIALGEDNVIPANPTDSHLILVEAQLVGASTFLGQRQIHHRRTLCKKDRLVHLLVEDLSRCVGVGGECPAWSFPPNGIRGGMFRASVQARVMMEQGRSEGDLMLNTRTVALGIAMLALASSALVAPASAAPAKPKYYFKISNIESRDKKIIPLAKELLEAEVATRPEFTMDLGDKLSEDALIAEIRKQGMLGFQVSLRITSLKQEIKPPAPGKRDQQIAIEVKLGIFGHTLPGNKLLFNGDGEASLMGEFSERLKEKEEERFMRTALSSALKQAVSTAVAKLTNAKLEDKTPAKGKKGKSKP
jgi:hypothetical protein